MSVPPILRVLLLSRRSGWLLALVAVAGFLFWSAVKQGARIREVTAIGAPADAEALPRGARVLLLPEASPVGFEWVAQAGSASAEGEWRVRHVGYDNAPFGRETHLASPYRWWLELVALFTPPGAAGASIPAVQVAVLVAGPWLHFLLLVAAGALVFRFRGAWPAAWMIVGGAAMFPFAGAFLPGLPDDAGLRVAAVLLSLLLLLMGLRPSISAGRISESRVKSSAGVPPASEAGGTPALLSAKRHGQPGDAPVAASQTRWFFCAAGVVGGLGLWANVAAQVPVLAGIMLGGLLGSGRLPKPADLAPLPWRLWARCGASVAIAGYLFEYLPGGLWQMRLEANHPLFALAWLGAAELLVRVPAGRPCGTRAQTRRAWVATGAAALAVLAVPVALWLVPGRVFPGAAGNLDQLSTLGGGVVAGSLGEWLVHDGMSVRVWAAFLPLLLVGAAVIGRLWFGRTTENARARLVCRVGLGPVVVLVVLGCFQLHWWVLLDAALLAVFAITAPASPSLFQRFGWSAALLAAVLPGAWLLRVSDFANEATPAEVEALVARDLAHWLARRAGDPGAVVLAPPRLTSALVYYGGLRGVNTPAWENQEGFTGAVRMMGSTSVDEAQALLERRGVRFLVLPSWDGTLREYARLGKADYEQTLAGQLDRWLPPRWLRPVPYQLPGIAGLEGREVGVFEVVEPAENSTALAMLAEYFLETNRGGLATAVVTALGRSFPNDLETWIARGRVALARRDAGELHAVIGPIETAVAEGREKALPWERRVSLALLLAQARGPDQVRPLVAAVLAEADAPRLRSLTTATLYSLLRFNRAAQLALPDGALQAMALDLLPPEWRAALAGALEAGSHER